LPAGRVRWLAVAMALLLALPAALVFKASYVRGAGLPLLHPVEMLHLITVPLHRLLMPYELPVVLTRDIQLRLAATLALMLLLLVVALARASLGRHLFRGIGLVSAAALCAFPATYLGQATAASAELARVHAAGEALFDAKCQTAGAKRLRSGVQAEGVRLAQVRVAAGDERHEDARWQGAGIPRDRVGQAYIESFLDFEYMDNGDHPGWNTGFMGGRVTFSGYRYVDVEQGDGRILRYRLATGHPRGGIVSEEIAAADAARHVVNYTSPDTEQERANWVASALVTVTDSQTGEVLGELRTAAFAPPSRQAFSDPQRRNWQMARTCPAWTDVPDAMARLFVSEVVKAQRDR
jgi:hypothetical protein